MTPEELLAQLDAIEDQLEAKGYNIVRCIVKYGEPGSTHFHTKLGVAATPKYGVTEDHVILDAQREILAQWDKRAHDEGC